MKQKMRITQLAKKLGVLRESSFKNQNLTIFILNMVVYNLVKT